MASKEIHESFMELLLESEKFDRPANCQLLLNGLPEGTIIFIMGTDGWQHAKTSRLAAIVDLTKEAFTADGRWHLEIVMNNAAKYQFFSGTAKQLRLEELIASGRRSSIVVNSGIDALGKLIVPSSAKHEELRSYARKYRDDFNATRDRLDELSRHKNLHALLHRLQFEVYTALAIEVRRPKTDAVHWEVLGDHAKSLGQIVPELLESSIFGKDQITWLPDARCDLQGAIKDRDFLSLEKARNGLGRVVTTWPSRLMVKLKQAAERLRLNRVVKDLSEIRDRAAAADLSKEKVALLASGVEALSNQEQHLKLLIENHDLLQTIDTHVRVFSRDPATVADALMDYWPWLNGMMMSLFSGTPNVRAESLGRSCKKMTDAVESDDRCRVADTFSDFRGVFGRYFLWVDEALKESCADVQKIGEPLTKIVDMLDGDA
jgi:hypothetical protein